MTSQVYYETMEVMNPSCQDCRLGTLLVPCPKVDKTGETCASCQGTGTRLHRRNVLKGEGPVPADILLVGEAPGHYEDVVGLPFRPNARAGTVLHNALREVGLEGQVRLDNVVRCRPPDNRLKDYPDAIEECQKWLWEEVKKVRPKVIVALGATAGGLWFPGTKATTLSTLSRATPEYLIVGAWHPSYVARGTDPTAWDSLLRSLARAKALIQEVR